MAAQVWPMPSRLGAEKGITLGPAIQSPPTTARMRFIRWLRLILSALVSNTSTGSSRWASQRASSRSSGPGSRRMSSRRTSRDRLSRSLRYPSTIGPQDSRTLRGARAKP